MNVYDNTCQLTSKVFEMSDIELGFAEKSEPWQLESRLFPSKIGGKPAWLDLKSVPKYEDLLCEKCKQPMIFLCQVYAPIEGDDENFHRTVFVFICRTSGCNIRNNNGNVKAFRSSLPQKNEFYPFDPPEEKPDESFKLSTWLKLCNVCGCTAEKICSKCKSVVYCCREHQILDWKENHKHTCAKEYKTGQNSSLLFEEFEIITETEEYTEKAINETTELEKFQKLQEAGQTGTLNDISESELESHAAVDADKAFSHFRKRIEQNPDQILRYNKGGQPLLISNESKPEAIPNCDYCGAERQFEFQIMPQILSILHEEVLDFGILAVYTCSKNCVNSRGYRTEYVFKMCL